mmetsp:Transcript_121519/g.288852  ORF Transcript_121519/g.288852 Transcript_121519/m.288852 type:complete len:233 (+) Transcript_121519:358-1056(+)
MIQQLQCCGPGRLRLRFVDSIAESIMQAAVVHDAVANVLGYQNFSANGFAGQSCMCCRPVAIEVPSFTCRSPCKLLHLQVLRHHTIASKASLCHPSAQAETTDLQSCAQVVQRASCEERRACITALQQHLRGRLDASTLQQLLRDATKAVVKLATHTLLVPVLGPFLCSYSHTWQLQLLQNPENQGDLLCCTGSDGHRTQADSRICRQQQQSEDIVRIAGFHVEDHLHLCLL